MLCSAGPPATMKRSRPDSARCIFGEQIPRRAGAAGAGKCGGFRIALQVYLQLARIHERNKKPQLALKAYEACSQKFGYSKKVWIAFLTFLYQQLTCSGLRVSRMYATVCMLYQKQLRQGDAEGARKVFPKSLAALEKRKHPLLVSKTALLEYQTL